MKKLVFLFIATLTMVACNSEKSKTDVSSEPITMEISVEGMTCNGCVGTVEASVKQMGEGITSVKVSLEEANAVVEYIPSEVKPKEIKAAIELNGYKVLKMEERGSDD